jgi:hypothetical protein
MNHAEDQESESKRRETGVECITRTPSDHTHSHKQHIPHYGTPPSLGCTFSCRRPELEDCFCHPCNQFFNYTLHRISCSCVSGSTSCRSGRKGRRRLVSASRLGPVSGFGRKDRTGIRHCKIIGSRIKNRKGKTGAAYSNQMHDLINESTLPQHLSHSWFSGL